MDSILAYINNLFSTIPDNDATRRLRLDMIRDGEERYRDYRAEGKNEAEAIGLVIQHFGNFDDIRQQYGTIESPTMISPAEQANRDAMVESFMRFRKRFALGIGIGVLICIFAIVIAAIADQYTDNEAILTAAFFVPVAIGVLLFVVYGIRYSHYTTYFKANKMYEYTGLPDTDDDDLPIITEDMPEQEKEYIRRRRRVNLIGNALTFIALIGFLAIGFFLDAWHPGWLIFLVAFGIKLVLQAFYVK
ncbi:MAG: hypothetical protein ACOYH4_00455 [Saccharofermentanales bacterium]|jgi:uncharacterized protein with PQ loop repeat